MINHKNITFLQHCMNINLLSILWTILIVIQDIISFDSSSSLSHPFLMISLLYAFFSKVFFLFSLNGQLFPLLHYFFLMISFSLQYNFHLCFPQPFLSFSLSLSLISNISIFSHPFEFHPQPTIKTLSYENRISPIKLFPSIALNKF